MSDSQKTSGALRSSADVQRMFDGIVRRYDLVNRLMTFGMDVGWRRLAVQKALNGPGQREARVLDVATGTGDLALALAAGGAGEVIGLDFSRGMIESASRKSSRYTPPGRVAPRWIVGDATMLPFPDQTFDALTVSFGLRNMPDYDAALREFARVLRPGGRLVCLELSPLRTPVIGSLFAFYFHRIVPVLGGILSGSGDAYRYLPASVDAFPDAGTLVEMMCDAGFERVTFRRLGAGTVAMHTGTRSVSASLLPSLVSQDDQASPGK